MLIGYSFEVDYLAALVRADVDDVYERLDVLLNEFGLVRPDDPRGARDRYAVHHPLLAEVLRERGELLPGTVLISGTIPMAEGVDQFAEGWRVELGDPATGDAIRLGYRVAAMPQPSG